MKKLLENVPKKNLLSITNNFKRLPDRYKTKIQKLILLVHTISEHLEIVIKNTIYNSIHKHEMLKNKFNKMCARSVY